jgi:nucleoside-diphosphate kinase
MKPRWHCYATRDAALAFCEGLALANDSQLSVEAVAALGPWFVVETRDEDGEDDDAYEDFYAPGPLKRVRVPAALAEAVGVELARLHAIWAADSPGVGASRDADGIYVLDLPALRRRGRLPEAAGPPAGPVPARLKRPPRPDHTAPEHAPLSADAEIGPFIRDGVVEDRDGVRWACGPLFASGVWLGAYEPEFPIRSRWLDAPLERHAGQFEAVYAPAAASPSAASAAAAEPGTETLVLLKPDALERGLVGEVLRRLEAKGLRVLRIRSCRPDLGRAERHYAEHAGKAFFGAVTAALAGRTVVAASVGGADAVRKVRALMGPWDAPPPGTIRGDLAAGTAENLIHGSATPEDAARELALWFDP